MAKDEKMIMRKSKIRLLTSMCQNRFSNSSLIYIEQDISCNVVMKTFKIIFFYLIGASRAIKLKVICTLSCIIIINCKIINILNKHVCLNFNKKTIRV